MDALDREILAQVQADGRLTLTELAGRVGLSVSPAHRRLRALERDGVITGYRAQLDPAGVGLGFEALVFVTLTESGAGIVAAFEQAVVEIPHVVQAQRLFGTPDFLLRVVASDLTGFQQLYDSKLATLPGVQKLTSTLVMKSVVEGRGLPL
ncbi:Lrp/AsnC family transcriptional regulator [Kineosporia babensis]|uniref:Lrp/AsnC family transcriptional regulator n=1 Tax=Kineosporia babensis TaxID=499548 RepID=A0A9X1N9X1_9ACTN|nr:Lrp/AsnC family transcriptional regulator [Kineosporia babensis]